MCGGIVERFGEPTSWWNNQDDVLTASAAHLPLAPVLNDYAWLWQDHGLQVPIQPNEYYVVAVEANGNLTLAHRSSGDLLLFAPDHALEGVTLLPGCPPYSLLTLRHEVVRQVVARTHGFAADRESAIMPMSVRSKAGA